MKLLLAAAMAAIFAIESAPAGLTVNGGFATWAMLIGGFGIILSAMRRRQMVRPVFA